ncbi:type IV secretion system protein [Streptococcus sp. R4]|uniref:type IV secretion system protein n=1 Tax=Streptococcus TaxID=1301 RepID=UPI001375397F|nr:type IV secretion system protein [Streptococcus agalactiae]MEE3844146.1 type IV secretion system protein [Streptococcus sp. R4]KAF1192026.1 conjugal transfer protein TrbL [Streptococcus agalactiae]KAF1202265.1 conjugal transfer protein TrbL [Streptococcus agalactiae]MEB3017903.1 type IV secretion system protein [Streptococcus agalactiae]MEC3713937.1 type IV secretion system protein [Streptococcus agalactiae]
MNNTLPSAFVFLASEKISSDSLFEGFNVDLESTANLVKSLADYNPTVWSYLSAITKGVMQPLGVAILAVVLVLEFSKMAKKIANSGGAMTFEAIAPMIVSYIMVAVVITNTTVIVEAILAVASHIIEGVAGVVSHGGTTYYETISGLKGSGIIGKLIVGFFAILIWLVRLVSVMVVNLLITIRFIQLYLMIPFAPLTIPTFLSDDWRSIGIGYLKNIMVYALQGVLIFLIISLVPLFESAGKLALSNGAGVTETLATAFGGLVQAILLIIALVGSQRTARSILGM